MKKKEYTWFRLFILAQEALKKQVYRQRQFNSPDKIFTRKISLNADLLFISNPPCIKLNDIIVLYTMHDAPEVRIWTFVPAWWNCTCCYGYPPQFKLNLFCALSFTTSLALFCCIPPSYTPHEESTVWTGVSSFTQVYTQNSETARLKSTNLL